jgi:hypothetical protein
MRGWTDAGGVLVAPLQQPRDQGVGAPHVPRAQLVATPGARGDLFHEFENPRGLTGVTAQELRAGDRRRDIGNDTRAPASHLVSEQHGTTKPATRQEAAEAIGVTFLMNGGPATIYGPRAYAAVCEFADAADAATGSTA